jgi:hypothetical protein
VSRRAAFSYRSARSGSFVAGIAIVLVVETVALHFLLVSRYPLVAWCLTASSIFAIWWVTRDYIALGRGAVRVDGDSVHLQIARRFDIVVAVANVARVLQPSYRDLPTPGTNQGRDYLDLTKPGTPNVLVVLETPTKVRLAAGVYRTVRRFALHLDDPAAFVAELHGRQTAFGRDPRSDG